MAPQNMDVVTCLQGCMKHIKYLPKILWRMNKAQATVGDLEALYKTIYHAFFIGNISRAQPQNVYIFHKIGTAFTDDLHRCANLIQKTIDFDESKRLKKFVMKPCVDENLDAKKRLFHGMPDILNQVAREELEGLSEEIDHCNASYLPQLGYLLVIDLPDGKTEADDHTIEGLQFKFASNRQLFYKSGRMLELDTQLGDIQLEISDMEVNILHGLQSAVLEHTQVLLDVMEMAAELDCLMTLAACASEFVYTRPNLVEEEVIDIKAGRHPLQELCCNPYVPNDTVMGGQSSRIHLLTGPNACGKSVYLKQVALIVFMSHIGSFVPAESARIGSVDRLFSRIKSTESVSNGMSTFLQDSLQISQALNEATQRSLVIVDEFGKGTESVDGLALLTAVIKFWISKRAASPYVITSTHYHSIIQQKLLPCSSNVQLLTLETLINGSDLVFLYQIKEGFASSSHACHIAAQVGLPQNIVKRGQMVSELISQNKSVPCLKEKMPSEQSRRHQQIVDAFIKLNLERDNLQAFLKDFVLQNNLHVNQQLKTQGSKQRQSFQEKSIPTKAKTQSKALHLSSPTVGETDSSHTQGTMLNSNGARCINPLDPCVDTDKVKQQGSKTNANLSQQVQVLRENNNRGLLQKKYSAAANILQGNTGELGTGLEHFQRTPLIREPAKKQKLISTSSCSSIDYAPSMKSSKSSCYPQRHTTDNSEGMNSCPAKSIDRQISSSLSDSI